MEYIDIDSRDFNYTNDGLFLLFKNYIEYKEVIYDEEGIEISMFQRMSVVCSAIGYLTDEKLLNHTLDYLKAFDLIEDIKEDFENELMSSYSGNDLTMIKAISFSLSSLYKLNIKSLKFPNSENSILLQIKIKDRIIEHNLQEALKSIHEKNVFYFENQISTLPINKQKEAIDIWIRGASKVAYSKKTKMFKEDIEYLKAISDHLIEPEKHKPAPKNSGGLFSVLEWATIFYYADETKLLPENRYSTTRRGAFIKEHNIETTPLNFKNEYHNAKKRINEHNNFPIEKLHKIIPFLKSNYVQAVDKVDNDINFLENELPD